MIMPLSSTVYARLSSYYFLYFAMVGTIIPYLSLYLDSLSLSAIEIAQILAVMSLVRLLSPIIWTQLTAYCGWRLKMSVVIASGMTFFFCLWFMVVDQFWWLFGLSAMIGFFWHAALPLFEALTLRTLADNTGGYSRIRLWGSLGFIFAVQGVGVAIDAWGMLVFLWLLMLTALLTLASAVINREAHVIRCTPTTIMTFKQVLQHQGMLTLLLVAMLMQVSHGVYYAFYSLLLADHGYDSTAIGALWSLGVVAEVAMFWWMHRVIHRLSIHTWLIVALCVSTVRWAMVAWGADWLWVLLFAQLFHAVTFALFHTAMMQALQVLLGNEGAPQGQALYASVAYGIGGVLGALLAGYAWAWGGGVAAFAVACAAAAFGVLLGVRYLRLPSYGVSSV